MPNNQYGFDPDRFNWGKNCLNKLAPAALKSIFGNDIIITALDDGTELIYDILDKNYGVDYLLASSVRNVSIAARVRGVSYYRYHDITIRHKSLQTPGKILESKSTIARYLFYGWVNTDKPKEPTKFVNWYMIRLVELLELYHTNKFPPNDKRYNTDYSSTFLVWNIERLKQKNLIFAEMKNYLHGQ